jgi:hypothetical protein
MHNHREMAWLSARNLGCSTITHRISLPSGPLKDRARSERFYPGSLEDQVTTDSKNLLALHDKLIARRRAIVESFQSVSSELLTGDAIARIQNAIEAVDRALREERRADSNVGEAPRLVTAHRNGLKEDDDVLFGAGD